MAAGKTKRLSVNEKKYINYILGSPICIKYQ